MTTPKTRGKTERVHKTAANAVRSMSALAFSFPEPPLPLDDRERIYYEALVKSREMDTWTDNDLFMACHASRVAVSIDELWEKVREHGYVQTDDRTGRIYSNPELGAIRELSFSLQAYNRMMGLSASQRGIAGSKQKERNDKEKGARGVLDAAAEAARAAGASGLI
jgi:phage terminase small subunit